MLLLLLSHFSHVRLCTTPWTAAHQAPLSLGFSRQEHWSGLPFPSPGDLSDPGIMKLQYFGHLMQRADSFKKTLMLGKIEGPERCAGFLNEEVRSEEVI